MNIRQRIFETVKHIKLSTIEKDLQVKYIQEYYNEFNSTKTEVIELNNLNIKQEKLISEHQILYKLL